MNRYILGYGASLYLIPILGLVVGMWIALRRPAAAVLFELVIVGVWLVSLALVAYCLILWQMQNIPVYGHSELYY